jgi:hypothetical protein
MKLLGNGWDYVPISCPACVKYKTEPCNGCNDCKEVNENTAEMPWKTLWQTQIKRVARKDYTCDICAGTIRKGSKYHSYSVGVKDMSHDQVSSLRLRHHADCDGETKDVEK